MRLTISLTSTSQILQLDVPEDISVTDLKALIGAEIPALTPNNQHLYHNGKLLQDQTRTLEQYAMKDDDMVVVHTHGGTSVQQRAGPSNRAVGRQPQLQQQPPQPGTMDSEMIRLHVLGNPLLQQELQNNNPELAAAINDPDRFRQAFLDMETKRKEAEREKAREIAMLNDDPFNIEAQRKIEELIRYEQMMENLQSTLEHHPEVTFGRVTMLYIPVEVNGVPLKAFVDSGAQKTLMSPDCAERCGIMRLIDTRFAGIAQGVGTANILGRVHSAQTKIGKLYLPCSFTVIEGKTADLLLGLDMLKGHQATIDLRKNALVIQDEEVHFLGESEIPRDPGEDDNELTFDGPAGSKVGSRTGAVVEPSIHEPPAVSLPREPVAPTRSKYSDEVIGQLESLGFTREQAISALEATNGDVSMAASLLFN